MIHEAAEDGDGSGPDPLSNQRNITMKAIGYSAPGPIDALVAFETDRPVAAGRDLLVEVAAVSVNPLDAKVRANRPVSGDRPRILGWDAAGTVVEVGDDVSRFEVGDKVWYAGDFGRQGTNAEFHLVDERIVGRMPTGISDAEAAAMPLTTLTAWETLFDRLRVTDPVPGAHPSVLIIGGGGGVGSIAIQLLRALTDLTVIATASRPETTAWVSELGAHHVIDHSKPLPAQLAAKGLGEPGFVFSTNYTEQYLGQIAELIAPQGRMGFIGSSGPINIDAFLPKSISVHLVLMFTRSQFQTADMGRQGEILDEVARLVDAGKVRSTLTDVLGPIDVDTLRAAHTSIETNSARGKLVLEGFQ